MGNGKSARVFQTVWRISVGVAIVAVICLALLRTPLPSVDAQSNATRFPPWGYLISNPTVSLTTATATTTAQPTSGASQAHIEFNFGTVVGSYTVCTVQAKTSYDGTSYLTLGSAASVTVTTSTLNAWDIWAQPANSGTPAVTVGAVSSTAALGFGQLTEYTLACTGYGTSAPVTITTIYK